MAQLWSRQHENENLPSFIVMNATWSGPKGAQALYNRLWGSGFLPSEHQGVLLRSQGDPVLFLSNPNGMSEKARKRMLDSLVKLNQELYDEVGDQKHMPASHNMRWHSVCSPPFQNLRI